MRREPDRTVRMEGLQQRFEILSPSSLTDTTKCKHGLMLLTFEKLFEEELNFSTIKTVSVVFDVLGGLHMQWHDQCCLVPSAWLFTSLAESQPLMSDVAQHHC